VNHSLEDRWLRQGTRVAAAQQVFIKAAATASPAAKATVRASIAANTDGNSAVVQ